MNFHSNKEIPDLTTEAPGKVRRMGTIQAMGEATARVVARTTEWAHVRK